MQENQGYFRQRAETELEMAKRAAGPEARKAHYRLAGYYLHIATDPQADAELTLEQVRRLIVSG